jgi:endonuclease G
MATQNEQKRDLDSAAQARFNKVKAFVESMKQRIAAGDYHPPKEEIEEFIKREEQQMKLDLAQRRRSTKTLVGLERQVGTTRDILSIEFLEIGQCSARAVGRIQVAGGLHHGTGVLVGENLLLTNNHVLPTESEAEFASLDLDLEENFHGAPKQAQNYTFDPRRFFITDRHLDFTIVAVDENLPGSKPLDHFGWHPLIKQQGKIRLGDPVNIIHHPGGGPKSITVHNSNFLHIADDEDLNDILWYSSDTEPGSSGAPVFNNRWEIVALHHCSIPKRTADGKGFVAIDGKKALKEEDVRKHPERAVWIANEGIRASRIVAAVEAFEFDDPAREKVRDSLVLNWERSNEGRVGHERTPPPPPVDPSPMVNVRSDGKRRSLRIEIDLD